MNDDARNLSLMIDGVSRAIAEWTVTQHAEIDETLATRYGDGWRRMWVGDVHQRIRNLAQAVAVRQPEVFASTIAWSNAAFAAREVDATDLRRSLECLRKTIGAELPPEAADAADRMIDAGLVALDRPSPAKAVGASLDGPHRSLSLAYLEAVLDGRRREAEAMVVAAADAGHSLPALYDDVLRPALAEIGMMWHLNELSIADEHLATATTAAVMAVLRSRFDVAPDRGSTVVSASAAGETHTLGVSMVADLFELDGWRSIYLGPDMPADEIVRCLLDHDADLLAASITSVLNLRSLGDLVAAVRGTPGLEEVRILVGGAPLELVDGLWRKLGADGQAERAEDAVAAGNRLVTPGPLPSSSTPG